MILIEEIVSIGVDIGTSTTAIIISRLEVEQVLGSSLLPVTSIGKTAVIYRSPIHFTPLLSNNLVDFESVKKYVEHALVDSGIGKDEIRTGAVIITGETSRKENASLVTEKLSSYLGEFVVATAGPKLESLLAGYGSLAWKMSQKEKLKMINLDIGGGTTNTVYFDSGTERQTVALDIGGRLVKIDEEGRITYISERICHILETYKIQIAVGDKVELSTLKQLCEKLAQCLLESTGLVPLTEVTKKLYITDVPKTLPIDALSFSGGVAEYIDCPILADDYYKHGDIGVLLGEEITKKFRPYKDYIRTAKEKIHATVIGAGSHSLSLSGSTIEVSSKSLPLKNVPIIKLNEDNYELLYEHNLRKMELYQDGVVAVGIKGIRNPAYSEIGTLADGILRLFEQNKKPIIVLIEEDIAMALGQLLKIKVKHEKEIICLDKIALDQGDYIDIGIPLASAVPVVVKTLIYQS